MTPLTGTIYETASAEQPPTYQGAPDSAGNYVFVCDSFYQVESGGLAQQIDGNWIQIAFDPPTKRGFRDESDAVDALKEHIERQFARLGVDPERIVFDELTDEELRPDWA